ncbi:MAG: hypothetical protein IKV36_04360 [Clostridia bacterium]|nr:hypothetical protein [Clostridia bacterium]
MKKVLSIAIILMMILTLVGCSGNSDVSSNETPSAPTSSDTSSVGSDTAKTDSGKITLGSAELSVGMVITEDIINKVGTPDDVMSAQSCFFDGEDTIYVYEDFSLYTYRDGDKNYLYVIELSTDKNATEFGGKVGMDIADIEELYGYNSTGTATSKVYKLGENSKLRFTYDESGIVVLIEYELIG